MMRRPWFDIDGAPREFKQTHWSEPVKEAIREIPGGGNLSTKRLDDLAQMVGDAIDHGETDAQEMFRPATREASQKQLTEALQAAETLLEKLAALKGPAYTALMNENAQPENIKADLSHLTDTIRHARSEVEGNKSGKGRRKDHVAEQITGAAREIWRQVTGTEPTFTSDPQTSKRSGKYIQFLDALFKCWKVSASAQSRAVQK